MDKAVKEMIARSCTGLDKILASVPDEGMIWYSDSNTQNCGLYDGQFSEMIKCGNRVILSPPFQQGIKENYLPIPGKNWVEYIKLPFCEGEEGFFVRKDLMRIRDYKKLWSMEPWYSEKIWSSKQTDVDPHGFYWGTISKINHDKVPFRLDKIITALEKPVLVPYFHYYFKT